jgi:DNA (cytosine-5)-methyltransferase 1
MTFGSLFAGIGGLDLGLTWAGHECCWQVEIDPWCCRVLDRHWPGLRRHDDIHTFPPGAPEEWHVDFICGGDPCQENSRARTARGLAQSSLGDQFIRVVAAIRPRCVLRENPTAVRPDAPWPWWRFRAALESLGYAVLPFRLRACCVGADHQRDRLFLLAALPDADGERLRLQGRGEDAGPPRALPPPDRQWQRIRPDAGPVLCPPGDLAYPRAPGTAHGFSRGLVGRRLKASGNAIHPDVAERIGRWLMAAAS